MSSLVRAQNYERTARDFGHCSQHAKNQYGFPFISHCVGLEYGSKDAPKKCTDSRFSTPCGDGTCKATYVDCLGALVDRDAQRRAERDAKMRDRYERAVVRSRSTSMEARVELRQDGVDGDLGDASKGADAASAVTSWTFGAHGLARPRAGGA